MLQPEVLDSDNQIVSN